MSKSKPKKKLPMTRRQKDVLEWITAAIANNGISPTVQQVADGNGISLGNASRYISELVDKGHLTKDPNRHVSIEIVE